jgi:resuscitation-promoting factor RpfB
VRKKAAILAVSAAVVAAGTGGAAAVASATKHVTLSVDGKKRQLSSRADTVGEMLESEGVDLGSRDAVAPDPRASLEDGTRVAVRYARPLDLEIDGGDREVWVTALSVDAALDQIGVREEGAVVSASRSARIPRDGMDLEVRTPQGVVVVADGKRRTVETTAPTVRRVLAEADVEVGKRDRVSAPLSAYPSDGQVVKVTRVKVRTVKERRTFHHRTLHRRTGALYEGQSKVRRSGDDGHRVKTFEVTLVDGERTKKKLVKKVWLDRPHPRVVLVGTKDRPAPQRASRSGGSSSSSSSSSSGSSSPSPSSDGLNWGALAACESGGDPNAVNPAGPYYGLYQFSLSTWQSVGGSGLPSDASSGEQTYRAQLLYQRAGAGQWPVCGSRL